MPHLATRTAGTLTAFVGLPASGKSTLAKQRVLDAEPGTMVRLNKDDQRAMMHGFWAGAATEQMIVASRNELIVLWLQRGVDVLVDDTNLASDHLLVLSQLAWECGARFAIVDLTDVPAEECIARDTLRGDAKVGAAVIRKMERQLAKLTLPPALDPIVPVDYDPTLPDVVLCDVDGTVAEMTDRSPYDWTRVGEDLPRPQVIGVVRSLLADGRRVIFLSGRSEECRPQTQAWLTQHVAPHLELFMRPAEDPSRRDSLVKYDLFNAHIRGRYNVSFVLDDRDRVVRMWRQLGVDCHQVAPGDF